jgi:hypothetical protein
MDACNICHEKGHTSRNIAFHPPPISKLVSNNVNPSNNIELEPVAPTHSTEPELTHNSILYFESSAGKGRGQNDSNNTVRELVLEHILTPACNKFTANDSPLADKWQNIRNNWRTSLTQLAETQGIVKYTDILVIHNGGRGSRCDYEVTFTDAEPPTDPIKVEFKFHEMPQFLNLPANKPTHPTLYAEFYYNHALDKVLEILGIPPNEKPLYTEWSRYLYNSVSSKHPFYVRMKAAEDEHMKRSGAKKSPQTEVVAESIRDYLNQFVAMTDLEFLTREFQTQREKHFLIYNYNTMKFHHDMYTPEELTAKRVSHISNNNTLVIETNQPGSYIHLLLRWKNHQGILFPAWQIKLVRQH